ncbi:hypothetical protein GCM10028820_15880 [Tessaracoccus terricola]
MAQQPEPPRPKLGLTTFKQVLVAALAGALLAAFLLSIYDLFEGFPPVVPWTVPAILVVMAVAAWIYSRGLSKRVAQRAVSGVEAVRALAIAKAAIMAGAILAGMHAVYVGRWIGQLDASQPAQRVLLGSVTLVSAILFTGAGHLLEKACVVPDDDDEDDESSEEQD